MLASGFMSPAAANSKYAAIVIHADTGDILFDKYSTQKRYPASLTKMMTLYLLFEELEAGRLTLDSKLKVSRYAAGMPASKLGLKPGETITVEKAIEALIIKSANDVAVVVAEKIGGSEKGFARKMTAKSRALGMRSTTFRNASGLPNRKQITTARDMAVLSKRVMQDFPQYWSYFQRRDFTWKGRTYKSHNKLVGKFDGADGLKTGYTRISGYNLATSIRRGDNRLIGIVLGGRSGATRDAHMRKILDQADKRIKANPMLVASVHRVRPVPNLKPTTLAELGGSWPPASMQMALTEEYTNAPTVGDSTALQYELAAHATNGQWVDESGLTTADDMSALIAMTDAERLNTINLAQIQQDEVIGEGDVDESAITSDFAWSIQTGAYRDRSYAEFQQLDAKEIIKTIVSAPQSEILTAERDGLPLYRVRFTALTEQQADMACSALIQNGGECFSMRDRDVSDQ